MTAIVSFAALFLSIFLVQMGSGTLGPLDALAASHRGFTTEEIGLLGSAHFVGFFVGCYITPRLIGAVGHSRCFAAAAAIGAIGALLHPVLEGPLLWAGLRVLTGIAISAAYTVIESWLQAKTENHNRGRVYGTFRVVDMTGQVLAQAMIAVLDPASYAAYNIVAVFCCLCLLPLALSRRVPPKTPEAPRLRPLAAWRLSPSAVVGVVVSAFSGAAFRMVGPVYALENGLDQGQIAVFLAAGILGGVIAQYPVGWIADKMNRRWVMIWLSVAAIAGCLAMAAFIRPGDVLAIYLGMAFFGATTLPIFSVASAYANDFAEEDFVVELNSALIFFFSVGAVTAPVLAARLISLFGPDAFFLFISGAHVGLIAFAIYRMTRREARGPTVPYRYTPRTSMVLARLFRQEDVHAKPEARIEAPEERTSR